MTEYNKKPEQGGGMSDLKPCPFCGSKNVILRGIESNFWLKCVNCGTDGPLCNEKSAKKEWNNRATPELPEGISIKPREKPESYAPPKPEQIKFDDPLFVYANVNEVIRQIEQRTREIVVWERKYGGAKNG